ncbi:MAG TPA: LLM class flavin-dependent oxidoreductase [Rugosibacter sp.]|nr:LLM class flavin-dependent oxidoreductase [Rugosibacter sp.]HPB89996.1 LLM class flavin-dependent oxidoreductase [Rugosibacter sp.]HQN45453.1 LLM class flavin-dependent oxidoreductase [Rugosibacter sp.]HQQ34866.1 LLM class flavin-dependent oxidoreductase [Rugosibacter sp.]
MSQQRQIHLAGFFSAGNVTHSHAAWRHARARKDFTTIDYYQHIARTLERGKFDLLFVPDALAVWDSYGSNLDVGLQYGGQGAVMLEPSAVANVMAAATQHIGIGATVSTTYYPPFHVARVFSTLDQLSGGRAAWNVVTSLNDAEARNFGVSEHLDHDRRYDRADEFLEAVKKLWQSWEEGALVLDKEGGLFADPAKVHYVDHEGEWFKVRGPQQMPRSPQGEPVILQAGLSPRGSAFAGRWAEAIFAMGPSLPIMKANYESFRNQVRAAGRLSSQAKVLTAVMPILGETESIARERQAYLNNLVQPEVGLSTLSSHTGIDFSHYSLDTRLDELLPKLKEVGSLSGLRMLASFTQGENITLREVGHRYGINVAAVPQLVGTGEQVADQLAEIFLAEAADGFVISPAFLPSAFDEFVDQVVPVLQARGLYREEYEGKTLRDHLGLAQPAGWQTETFSQKVAA